MVGEQLGNYRVIEKLGEGGMGAVYRAVDVMLERDVALKFLRPELSSQPDLVERFRTEAVVLARLHHPNIASIFGLHKHEDQLFMAMEFVPGKTLESLIQHDGPMTPDRAATVAAMVLQALEYAHRQGVIHRDIKSQNIIVTPEGVAKVMDFGIARVLGGARHTRVGFVVGTLAYMSPEQIRGEALDGRSDLYSLGVVLYEMLAGRLPFEADTEWALMQAQVQQAPPPLSSFVKVGPPLEDVVLKALEKTPSARYGSATEFKRALVHSGVLPVTDGGATTVAVPVGDLRPPSRVTPLPFAASTDETALHVPIPAPAPAPPVPPVAQGFSPASAPPAAPGTPTVAQGFSPASPGGEALPAPAAQAPETPARRTRAPKASGTRAPRGTKTPAEGRAAAPKASPAPPVEPAPGEAAARHAHDVRKPAAAAARPAAPAAPAAARTAASGAARRGSSLSYLGAAAALALVVGAGGYWWWKTQAARVPEPVAIVAESPVVEPPLVSRDLVIGFEPVAPVAPAITWASLAPAAPAGQMARAGGAGAPAKATLAQSRPGQAPAAPLQGSAAVPAIGTVAPAITPTPTTGLLSPVRFTEVKLAPEKGPETDVLLELNGDRLVVRSANGRSALRTLPYRQISRATYAQSKRSVLVVQTTRHWLTLETGNSPLRLRLDKDNARAIIDEFKNRSGKQVAEVTEK